MLVVMQSHPPRSRSAKSASARKPRLEGAPHAGSSAPHRHHRQQGRIDLGILESLPGVIECIPVSKPYKLGEPRTPSRKTLSSNPTPSGDVIVGGDQIASLPALAPSKTESNARTRRTPQKIRRAAFPRGLIKPRTSPYSFQGLGETASILSKVRATHGFVSSPKRLTMNRSTSSRSTPTSSQIGARNMQISLAQTPPPPRNPSPQARHVRNARRIPHGRRVHSLGGQLQRNALRSAACAPSPFFSQHPRPRRRPGRKKRSHLPIFVDPATAPASVQSAAALPRRCRRGADGLLIEVHSRAEKASPMACSPSSPRNSSSSPTKCAKSPPSPPVH